MRQATIHATITDTTPEIITALLTRASTDPAQATKVWPPDHHPTKTAIKPATSTHTPRPAVVGSLRIPICGKPTPIMAKSAPARARGSCDWWASWECCEE